MNSLRGLSVRVLRDHPFLVLSAKYMDPCQRSGEVCSHRLYNGGQITKVILNKISLCCAEHLTEESYGT